MQNFTLSLLLSNKLIQIRGKINQQDQVYARFLQVHRKPNPSPLLCLAQRIQYQGCELQQNLLFTLIIIIAQTYNIVSFPQNQASSISTIVSVAYALTFCCLVNFKREICVQLGFFALFVGLLTLLININVVALQVAIALIVSFGLVLASKLLVYFQEYVYTDTPNFGFSFESNLIIAIFLFWKAYEVTVLSNYELLSAIITLALINTIKVYHLFDYNVLSIINILCENTNHQTNRINSNSIELSQTVNLYVQTKEESNQTNSELKQQIGEKVEAPFEEEIPQSTLDDKEAQQMQKQYNSKRRVLISIIMLMVFISQIIFTIVNKSSNQSSILLFFFYSSCSTLFLLMLCEYEKIIRNCQKCLFTYVVIYGVDTVLIVGSAIVAYYHTGLSLDFTTSIFFSIASFIAIKQFNYISESVHQSLNNSEYSTFFLLFLLPFCVRSIAQYKNYTILLYLIDGFIYLYTFFIVGIWSNRSEIASFAKQIKSILSVKKQKLRLFQRLKHLNINYTNLVQTYIYVHVIFLNTMYSLTSFADFSYQVQFFIVYFSPLFLYFTSLINTYKFLKSRAESYSPYLLNVVALVMNLSYILLSYFGYLDDSHYSYGLLVLLNIFLFVGLAQGEKIAILNLYPYSNFIRVLLLTLFFVFIYFPFIAAFISFYFFTNFSQQYFYYFSLSGFFFLWIIITVTGISIHLVLNLTEKSKKDLFIAQYMENQLGKIGLKEDIEKFLMISNMYEILNEKSDPLLKYLKEEKNVKVIVRRQKDIVHDYELVQPQKFAHQNRLSIVAKPVNPHELFNLIKNNQYPQNQESTNENPVATFFKQKEKNRIEITKPIDVNDGLIQLKRMAQANSNNPLLLKNLQKSQQFKEMQMYNQQKLAQLMSRFYNFISEPSQCISRQTFFHLMKVLTKEQSASLEQSNKIYNKFGESSLMNQYKFKKFIIDYVEYKYTMQNNKLQGILRTFCCYEIVPLLQAKFKQFEYHLKRKRIEFTKEKRQIWLKDGDNEENMQVFREYKLKELRKKERVLNYIIFKTTKHIEDDIPNLQYTSDDPKKSIPAKATLHQQLKDKTFLKPESIYAIIVNSLIQCYLYYQKQSQNFKITSIKCSVSNILAIVTKIIDIIFVFGYSTVYLLIAYYYQNFTATTYALSSINYLSLIILTGLSTLIYIALIFYHKKDFELGTLGLDDQRRSLSLCDFKFYTTSFLFLLGSALANYIISIALNSFLCNQQADVLYNFNSVACYSNTQYVYLFISLLILIIYWPLSAITFPFSTAMDRSLEIKYKSQFEIVYLQFKFLINGYNTLLVVFGFQVSQLIISILKVGICCILALLYMKLQPCSYELMNKIQGKVYILLTILSFTGTLCYFVGMLYSVLITGSFIVLYLIYFIYLTIKSYRQLKNQNVEDDLIQDNIKNQNIKIKIMRDNNKSINQTPAQMKSVLTLKNQQQTSNVKLLEQAKKSGQIGEKGASYRLTKESI